MQPAHNVSRRVRIIIHSGGTMVRPPASGEVVDFVRIKYPNMSTGTLTVCMCMCSIAASQNFCAVCGLAWRLLPSVYSQKKTSIMHIRMHFHSRARTRCMRQIKNLFGASHGAGCVHANASANAQQAQIISHISNLVTPSPCGIPMCTRRQNGKLVRV